jgi:hypothetical protein
MGYSVFFNLIAAVIRSAITNCSFTDVGVLEDEDLDQVNREIDEKLKELFDYYPGIKHDKIRLDPEVYEDIINWCQEKNDMHLYIHLLMRLDHMVNIDKLCLEYGIKATAFRNREAKERENPGAKKGEYIAPCFDALNTNIEETGILLLPDFRIPTEYDDENEESKEISRMSGLNDILHSLSFIKKETLNDFRLNNVILDPERRFEQIRIAFTPTTKKDKAEMFQVGEKVALQDESGHNCVYLGDITLKNKDNITEHFKKCLH